MDQFRAPASEHSDWLDSTSPSTSEDCGASSPQGRKFVLLPDWKKPTNSELCTQREKFAVTLTLQEEMTETGIRELVTAEFLRKKKNPVDLRDTRFDFVTIDNDVREYNCPCGIKKKCNLKYQEGHHSAEWNTTNIRRAAKGNRNVYIRKTADSTSNSNSSTAIKRFCTGEPKAVSSDEHDKMDSGVDVTQSFMELDITFPRHVNQEKKEVEEDKSVEGNCTRDPHDGAYSSLSAESSTITSAMSLPQTNSEENQVCTTFTQQIDHEQEATSSLTLHEQERRDMDDIMKPVLGEISCINPTEGDIAGGYEFVMLAKSCIFPCGLATSDGLFARFGESNLVKVSLVNPYSVEGCVPAGTKTGSVMASLYLGPEENLQLVGVRPFEYTDENDPANVVRLLENQLNDDVKLPEFLHRARRIQGNRKLNTGTSANPKEQCGN